MVFKLPLKNRLKEVSHSTPAYKIVRTTQYAIKKVLEYGIWSYTDVSNVKGR